MALHHFRTPRAILHPPRLEPGANLTIALTLCYLPHVAGAVAGTVASEVLRGYVSLGLEPWAGAGLGVSIAATAAFWLALGS